MKYAIADKFTIEARRVACEKVYEPRGRFGIRRYFDERQNHFCPLGVALLADGYTDGYKCSSPKSCIVLYALGINHNVKLCDETANFINDWDTGRITDLYEALGVPHSPRPEV